MKNAAFMKSILLAFLAFNLSLAFSVSRASAEDADVDEEIANRDPVGLDLAQLKQIQKHQTSRQCPGDYKNLFAQKTIRISMFNGYQNFDDKTQDSLRAKAMTASLLKKCEGGLEACGFKLLKNSRLIIRLEKDLNGKKVVLNIFNTSISDNNFDTMSASDLRDQQARVSAEVKNRFYKELVNSDVVFYSGHSRYGAGLGFDIQDPIPTLFNIVTRLPYRPILAALAQKPSRLKMLGLFSCQSEKYYRAGIEAANPSISLLLTTADIWDMESEQAEIASLDSLLSQKCQNDFVKTLVPEDEPQHIHIMKYIRH